MAVLSVMALEGPGDKRIDHQTLVKPTDWMNSLPPHLLNQWGVTLPDQAEGSLSDEDLPIGSDHIYMVMKNYWGHGIPDSEEYVREWTEDTEDVLKFTLMKLEMDLGLPIPLLISRHEKTTPYTEMMGLLQTVCKRLEERVGELEGADDQSPKVKDEVTEKKRLLRLAKEMYQGNDAQVNVRVVTSLALFRSLQASAQASSTASSSPQRAQSPPPPPPADIQFDDLSSSAVIVIVAPEEPVNELRSNPPNQTVSALPQDSPESDTGVVLTPTNSPPLPLVTSSPRNTEQQTASAQQASLPTIPEVGEDMAPVRPIATFPATGSKSKKKKNKGKKSKGKKQSSQELPLPTSTLDAALPETPATMDVATQTAEHEWSAAPLHLKDANQVEPPVGSPTLPANSASSNEAGHPSFQTATMTAQTAEPQSPTPSEDTDEQQFWNPWWNLHFHSRTHLFWQRRNGRPEAIELSALTRTNIDSPCYFFPDCQQHKGTQLCWCPDCRDGQNPRWCCCAHYAHYCIVSSRSRKQDLMVLQYPGCQNPALSSQYYVSRFTFPGLANNPAPAQVTPAEVTTAEASTARATTSRAITSRATTSRAITFRANTTRATTARATAEANNSRAPAGDTTTKTSKRKKTNKNKRKYNQRLMQMQQEQAMTSTAEPEPTLPAPSPELCAQPSGAAEVTSDPSSEDVVFSSSPLIPEPSSRLRRASWPLSLLSIEEVYPLT